ncbi:phage tail sheath C-terminal domain-containing protein [Aquimarina sp. 2201CG5-10]|uniref:phage tail sheath C-terminal domain-containing protein n=1 Tax=Aquimarina callyspongiae TaxID=3098150 RepID=UPI002AB4A4DC|nr:phage tail sheath C-terminal domain-containing protein [Aquimarina sp. 2201CG5-10]MDY8138099.1 phage tail sheath C-terminal domain-containing protein [Aquimarina sp. 2201CG5-10]
MATTYKTPGVYIEEIVKFPPSVAQVETAIPAFIGYTEKATNKIKGDLKDIPTRITSMLEYETFFGFAKPETTISVTINDELVNGAEERSIIVDQPTEKQPFLMYYSLQMYFANGGGPCYIVSVGRYGNDLDDSDTPVTAINNTNALKSGLAELKKVDEPTLILFPDATRVTAITATDFYGLYNDALDQCNELQDRFTIIDTLNYDGTSPTDTNINDLRNNISSDKDYIKYGAAYYPYLETILDYSFDASEIVLNHFSYEADAYELIKTNIAAIEDPTSGMNATVAKLVDLVTSPGDISGDVSNVLFYMYGAAGLDLATPIVAPAVFTITPAQKTAFLSSVETLLTSLKELIDFKESLNDEANAAASTIKDEDPALAATIEGELATFNIDFEGADKIDEVYANLQELYTKMQNANTDTKVKNLLDVNASNFSDELQKLETYTDLDTQTGITSTFDAFANIATNLTNLTTEIKNVEGQDRNNGDLNGRNLSDVEAVDNATYNRILSEIGNLPMELPPSCTMAGIYAKVDSDRGVWKAPANVSVNYVIKPTVKVTNTQQDGLNVDAVAGKSINAIRTFTGKGVMVWGARTLAGNDKEWRYVPVRRFFNMAEESIKKATEQFVFEPNDMNTWVRVKAMINNFLTLQWRAGALAGPTPDKAFYVNVGLGETMTANDILDGNMIIEIGMAVVRPAEFIILKFSHKMQEA